MPLKSLPGIHLTINSNRRYCFCGNENNVGGFEMSLENLPELLGNISEDGVKTEEIHSYQFKSFTLKPVERQLFDGERQLPLTPKAFDILTHLVANAGHLVTKDEILNT